MENGVIITLSCCCTRIKDRIYRPFVTFFQLLALPIFDLPPSHFNASLIPSVRDAAEGTKLKLSRFDRTHGLWKVVKGDGEVSRSLFVFG